MGLLNVANGLLSRTLLLLAPTRTRTATGGWTDTFVEVASLRGMVTTPRGRPLMEKIVAEQPTNAVLVEITVRETYPLTSQMRISDGARLYDIVGVERAAGYAILVGREVEQS